MFHVFVRNWWKKDPKHPSGRVPGPGKKSTLARVRTREEAWAICEEYNKSHEPGFLSRKAEWTEE